MSVVVVSRTTSGIFRRSRKFVSFARSGHLSNQSISAMTSSDDVLTRHTWKPGCVCLNMIMHSETFSLEGNQAVKFSMFIKNDTGNRYGFSYGLQLQALDVMGSVDLQVKVCVEDEYGWKSEDRVGRFLFCSPDFTYFSLLHDIQGSRRQM